MFFVRAFQPAASRESTLSRSTRSTFFVEAFNPVMIFVQMKFGVELFTEQQLVHCNGISCALKQKKNLLCRHIKVIIQAELEAFH